MKAFFAALLMTASLPVAPAYAASLASPVFGHWSVDVSRLPMAPQARPRSVTFDFSDAGNGKLCTVVDIVDAGGTDIRAEGVASLDGTPSPVTGSPEADTAAFTMPQPNVLVMALSKGGVPASTRVYSVAADGNTMVETDVYFANDGKPIIKTHYLTRKH